MHERQLEKIAGWTEDEGRLTWADRIELAARRARLVALLPSLHGAERERVCDRIRAVDSAVGHG